MSQGKQNPFSILHIRILLQQNTIYYILHVVLRGLDTSAPFGKNTSPPRQDTSAPRERHFFIRFILLNLRIILK